jgi:hypothetical protein
MLKADSKLASWTDECQKSHDCLVARLTCEPILAQPDLTKPFRLYSDASNVAIGGMLTQKDKLIKEHVISYASRILKGAELNYGISDKERLGVVFLVRKFRIYLYGVHFTVVTDHKGLMYVVY